MVCSYRQEKAVPVLTEFKKWLEIKLPQVPPKSLLGKAIIYTLNQWNKLIRYTEDSCLTPDNNIAENAIRAFCGGKKELAVCRKFSGSESKLPFFSA